MSKVYAKRLSFLKARRTPVAEKAVDVDNAGSLAANPPLFPCLAEQTLCEIQPFLCFC